MLQQQAVLSLIQCSIQNLLCVKATFANGLSFAKANSAEFGLDAQILGCGVFSPEEQISHLAERR